MLDPASQPLSYAHICWQPQLFRSRWSSSLITVAIERQTFTLSTLFRLQARQEGFLSPTYIHITHDTHVTTFSKAVLLSGSPFCTEKAQKPSQGSLLLDGIFSCHWVRAPRDTVGSVLGAHLRAQASLQHCRKACRWWGWEGEHSNHAGMAFLKPTQPAGRVLSSAFGDEMSLCTGS